MELLARAYAYISVTELGIIVTELGIILWKMVSVLLGSQCSTWKMVNILIVKAALLLLVKHLGSYVGSRSPSAAVEPTSSAAVEPTWFLEKL
jgi:hypothetical protein